MTHRYAVPSLGWALFVALACNPTHLQPVEPGMLAMPAALSFPDTVTGGQSTLVLAVTNRGLAPVDVKLSTSSPFSSQSSATLAGASTLELPVTFAPQEPIGFEGTLEVGDQAVRLVGRGVSLRDCQAGLCQVAAFDVDAGVCRSTPVADGTSCSSPCVSEGTCRAGQCAGTFANCDDSDPCTVDACGAEGCVHTPLQCPTTNDPCRVNRCGASGRCEELIADDGVLCGPNDCLSTSVDVCLAGACVERPRPDESRCANRWVPFTAVSRYGAHMVFDDDLGHVIMFGGQTNSGASDETFTWNGSWVEITPAVRPPATSGGCLAYDSRRARAVAFTGVTGAIGDTWEFDGKTWLRRTPASPAPSPALECAMAYDVKRARTVMFGVRSSGGVPVAETWEWNGQSWSLRPTPVSPPKYGGSQMVYDEARGVVMLVGVGGAWTFDGATWRATPPLPRAPTTTGGLAYDARRDRVVYATGSWNGPVELLEWDGSVWRQVGSATVAPPGRISPAMAYDRSSRQTLLYGGLGSSGEPLSDAWAWDGASWQAVAPVAPSSEHAAVAADPVRKNIILFGGGASRLGPTGDTWKWYGGHWSQVPTTGGPQPRRDARAAYDSLRSRVMMFGGETVSVTGQKTALNELWAFDGARWAPLISASAPAPRVRASLAYDPSRDRLVLFGGSTSNAAAIWNDTWEWNGASWALRSPAHAPSPRYGAVMAWDPQRSRVLLFGGVAHTGSLDDTWEWDGSDWQPLLTGAPPYFSVSDASGGLVFDPLRGVMVLVDNSDRGVEHTWELGATWVPRRLKREPLGVNGVVFEADLGRVMALVRNDLWVLLP